jgi:hypothetical protein
MDWEDSVEAQKDLNEKRKHLRHKLDLPLDYQLTNSPRRFGALVVNVSESGLFVHSTKDIPPGTKLNVAVLFPKEFEFSNFKVVAEIVWKDIHWGEDWIGYQLGLKFVNILEEDHRKLKELLDDGHGC